MVKNLVHFLQGHKDFPRGCVNVEPSGQAIIVGEGQFVEVVGQPFDGDFLDFAFVVGFFVGTFLLSFDFQQVHQAIKSLGCRLLGFLLALTILRYGFSQGVSEVELLNEGIFVGGVDVDALAAGGVAVELIGVHGSQAAQAQCKSAIAIVVVGV